MYYFFSKALAFMLSPWTYILACLVVAAFMNTRKRRLIMIGAAAVLLLISSNVRLQENSVKQSFMIKEADSTVVYDYVIVPGGYSECDSLRHRIEYNDAADRLLDAVHFYKSGKARKVLVTGDDSYSVGLGDSSFFRHYMITEFSIKDSDLIIEPNALNTFQNIQFSQRITGNKSKVLIVNSDYVMQRTIMYCKQLHYKADFYSVDVIPQIAAADNPTPITEFNYFIVNQWQPILHEWIGGLIGRIIRAR